MKKVFVFISSLLICVISYSQIPSNGLVAYYPFNGDAIDESANSNDLNINNATLTRDRFGIENSAFSFASSSMQASNSILTPSDKLSVSFWVLVNPNSQNQYFITNGGETRYSQGFSFLYSGSSSSVSKNGHTPNSLVFAIANSELNFRGLLYTDEIPTNEWVHVIGTWDGTGSTDGMSLCINGHPVNASSSIVNSLEFDEVSNLHLGRPIITTSYSLQNGKLDDILIYDRVLNTSEKKCLYKKADIISSISEENSNRQNIVSIYPSPTSDYFKIDTEENIESIQIFNEEGKLVKVVDVESAFGQDLEDGIYFIKVIFDNDSKVIKVKKGN